MASENRYLFRAPLLDAQQRVTGYMLGFQQDLQDSEFSDEVHSRLSLALLAAHPSETPSCPFFLEVSPVALFAEELAALPSQGAVLILRQGDLSDEGNRAVLASLRQRGMGLALRNPDLAFLEQTGRELLLAHLSHVLVDFDHPERAAITSFARQRPLPLGVVVDKVPGWHELETSAGAGVDGVFADLCQAPRDIKQPVKLGPQAQQILQLMQMVQGNADIRNVEKVLKSDVTLSYKLLRYINSAGFGLQVEIESLRHAVAMLGYAPLFRWLLLLLARTYTAEFSPALMQAAMVRGRFAELLGQGFFSRREAENLFVVGMFSFLDRLLGIPMREVLSQLVLPAAVSEALLARKGVYAPVLALAEACEGPDGRAAEFVAVLSMKAEDVNQAHLSALAWARSIKI